MSFANFSQLGVGMKPSAYFGALTICCSAFLFSGCIKPVEPLPPIQLKTQTPITQEVVVKDYAGQDLSGGMQRELIESLASSLPGSSAFPLINNRPRWSCFNNMAGGRTCKALAKGVGYSVDNKTISIGYHNKRWDDSSSGSGYRDRDSSDCYAIMDISYRWDGNQVIFTPPSTLRSNLSTRCQPFVKSSEIQADGEKVFSSIPDLFKNLEIYPQVWINGEVNSRYPKESIIANFDRTLEKKYSQEDTKNKEYYVLELDNGKLSANVRIEVAPYRNGTKLVYEAKLKYRLHMTDGPSFSPEKAEEIKRKIADIVNQ